MSRRTESLLQEANSNDDNETSVSFAKRVFADAEAARRTFSRLKDKILDVKEWNNCSLLTSFKLFDENGEICRNQRLFAGALNRMTMRGSGKNDWVRVVEIYEAADEKIITVKPAADPTEKKNAAQTSHFFTSEACNNFCLLRHEQTISSYVIGLREKQNDSETGGIAETLRNVAVANIGSYFGVQKAEWTTFCENFLNSEN